MLTAKDIMTTDVITVRMDTTVKDLAEILWKNRISGAPVLDDEGKVISVVTENDLIDQSKKFHIPTMISLIDSVIFLESSQKTEEEIKKMAGNTVRDICAKKLVSVSEDTGMDEIATIMAEKKVHTLPVIREDRLIGVIGKTDIIRTMATK
ncbi:MAG: CBS domain-containing protein [Deltaproteobacteria bacterium]|jgi:CBS-domain-containing membrane protein|nr:CBS domain-containing protein [Deltaproteobacteria bacterium]